MGILTKIRQRPDNQKRIFSFVSAAIVTLVIFVVWLSFGDDPIETKLVKEDTLSSLSPIQVMKEEFSKALSDFKESTESMSSTTDYFGSSTVPVEVVESTSTATSSDIEVASSTISE